MIEFNIPPCIDTAFDYMADAVRSHKICGDGAYTKKCSAFLADKLQVPYMYLTPSGTASLEMSAILSEIKPGDEVILPSYTFCSTADAFVQRGATLVFVDIRPDTLNLDETKIEEAITDKTKAIVPVHYAGVACEMDTIMEIARRHNLYVAEDAAQAIGSTYKGRYLGTIGDFGCFSFHETKNYSMGEGGAFCFNNEKFRDAAEICREKGTDRSQFFRGQVDKYTWRDYGSSYLASDLNAAYLWAQLEAYDTIFDDRMASWNRYQEGLKPLAEAGYIEQPVIPEGTTHNAHMYYLKVKDMETRQKLIAHLRSDEIQSVFHYIPLHSAPAGIKFGRFHGEDRYTTKESERLMRLPMYYGLTEDDTAKVIESIKRFFS
ncbi:MAG: dTDP-4-amino-4,6-dideoxygalactose transaminase [Lachnospiraceae bacterium]|nr:dTDP-4-amino-4,6-dideoxygalactose transaminase [Lachnospiraceae bacterium]